MCRWNCGWICLVVAGFCTADEVDDNLKAYPPAPAGMTRHVLRLPKEAQENALKVEFTVGKLEMTDDVNTQFFSGRIEEAVVEGWGFSKYTVKSLGPIGSTLIGVDPSRPLVKKFVSVQPILIRYNSRLPVVVYTPKDAEVRYRLWRTEADFKPVAP